MKRYARYTKQEDEIILAGLRDVDANTHRLVMQRSAEISEQYLPHRPWYCVRDRWYALIGKKVHKPKEWVPVVRHLNDLVPMMSDERRAKIKIRLPKRTLMTRGHPQS